MFNDINSSARSTGGGGGGGGRSSNVAPIRGESSGPSRGKMEKLDCFVVNFSVGLCAGCNQGVHGEVLQSMGKLWHPEHFNCGNCQQNLGCQPFFEYEGQPHCEKCYRGLFCPRCAKCDKVTIEKLFGFLFLKIR